MGRFFSRMRGRRPTLRTSPKSFLHPANSMPIRRQASRCLETRCLTSQAWLAQEIATEFARARFSTRWSPVQLRNLRATIRLPLQLLALATWLATMRLVAGWIIPTILPPSRRRLRFVSAGSWPRRPREGDRELRNLRLGRMGRRDGNRAPVWLSTESRSSEPEQAPIASPAGGATVDSEARATLDQVLMALREHGLAAT